MGVEAFEIIDSGGVADGLIGPGRDREIDRGDVVGRLQHQRIHARAAVDQRLRSIVGDEVVAAVAVDRVVAAAAVDGVGAAAACQQVCAARSRD